MKNKIVLAYSGGLDTSVMIKWLKDTYNADIIAAIIDVGQNEDLPAIKKRALNTGALKAYVIDAKKEFVTDIIYPAVKANAIYEHKYLLGTSLARPIIAKKIIEIAKKENAWAVSHGATGKGNDQVRFEITFRAFAPGIKIIAPWREWTLKSRTDEIEYAQKHKIPITVTKKKPYSSDANLWHISYEGGILEDPNNPPPEDIFQLTKQISKTPDKPGFVEICFEKGVPKKINGKTYEPVALIAALNKIGGEHCIGRTDLVENRLVGMKSRGVYETPGGTLLIFAHRELEYLTIERETFHYKEVIEPKYAELIYNGLWYSPLREALDGFINETQKYVTGSIKLKLFKGNINVEGRKAASSLYWEKLATFEKEDIYDQRHAEGFIKLFGLPVEVNSILRKK
ncbi:MAG: argininosuccinate synthase [Elusimicrobia bacterium]|nr:argininosuccinate synthase [Elusimicrobiota bacterium]MBU2614136.1 argininosuccinate synthase [Elusimicrobiota bacterium]